MICDVNAIRGQLLASASYQKHLATIAAVEKAFAEYAALLKTSKRARAEYCRAHVVAANAQAEQARANMRIFLTENSSHKVRALVSATPAMEPIYEKVAPFNSEALALVSLHSPNAPPRGLLKRTHPKAAAEN